MKPVDPKCGGGTNTQRADVRKRARTRAFGQAREKDSRSRRCGERLEIRLHDDGQRTERSDVEPAHVVAGNVFDDHPTGARDGAVGEYDGGADDVVAWPPVQVPARSQPAGGERSTQRCVRRARGIERYELTVR